MAYRKLINKFSAAYELIGIYLHDSGRIITLTQGDPKGLIILRENMNKLTLTGSQNLTYQNKKFGAIINDTKSRAQIILLATFERINVLGKHWSRILPAILKSLPVDEIVEEESPITQLARLSSQISEIFDNIIDYYDS